MRPQGIGGVRLHTSRWRSSAFARSLRAILAAVTLASASADATESAITSIQVRHTEDTYVVDLVAWVRVPPELAFEVLVDFERMASWVPNVRESRVLRRAGGRATIEYQGVVTFGFLAFPYTTVREIEFAAPAWIHTTQVEGTMKRHESHLSFVSEGKGTRMDYHVEMVPGTFTAIVLNKRRVESEVTQHFEAINAELLRRRDATAPAPQ